MNEDLDNVTNAPPTREPKGPVSPRRARWVLWLAAAGLVLAVAVVSHRAILRAAANLLIVEIEQGFSDAVWLADGDHRFQTAADLYQEDPRRVILIGRSFPDRLVELGILPPREEVARSRLEERGVPAGAIEFFGEKCRDIWETGRAFKGWMAAHPRSRILILCDRFRSRQTLLALEQVLDADEIARIGIRPLRGYRYDETNWWKVRSGVKGFVSAWLGLWCVWAFGEPPQRPEIWTVDEYEAEIARRIQGASR